MRTTSFFNENGKNVQTVNGFVKSIEKFEAYSQSAAYVRFSDMMGWASSDTYFKRCADGTWVSPMWQTSDGYARKVLTAKKVNYAVEIISISNEEAEKIITAETKSLLGDAASVINWCGSTDEAYRGAGAYRLIIQGGEVKGAIYGGFHGCRKSMKAMLCSHEAFVNAIYQVVEGKIGHDFKIVEANGSGNKFYLRERIEGVETTEFDVPSVNGGMHNNIEIK